MISIIIRLKLKISYLKNNINQLIKISSPNSVLLLPNIYIFKKGHN